MVSDSPPFFTDDEIAQMCAPLVLPGAQCRYLEREGFLISRKPNGKPLLARSEYERVLNPKRTPPPAPPYEPEIVGPWMPVRREWQDTPLGRWQQQVRENKSETDKWMRENTIKLSPAEIASRERAQIKAADEARVALVRHHAAKRRTTKLNRTPAWADMAAIREVYARAQEVTRETGIPHHVDHEIPLQGKLVSGLHVHNNLQILTGSENSKKHNRFEVA